MYNGDRASFLESTLTATGKPLSLIRSKIKYLETHADKIGAISVNIADGVDVSLEQVLIDRKVKTIRRVYVIQHYHSYKVGWVVDQDVNNCMVCVKRFNWMRYRHHCRACGILVCNACSPFKTFIPLLDEEGGSRVCVNCFGLKCEVAQVNVSGANVTVPGGSENIFSPSSQPRGFVRRRNSTGTAKSFQDPSALTVANVAQQPKLESEQITHAALSIGGHLESNMGSPSSDAPSVITSASPGKISKNKLKSLLDEEVQGLEPDHYISKIKLASSDDASMQATKEKLMLQRLEEFERDQIPKYLEAYRTMRRIVPPNITKTKFQRLLADGLPERVAQHIWDNKALWLICMHRNDIHKVHVGDLRGKYNFHVLDLTELRAVWYALPEWSEVFEPQKFEWKEGFKMKLDEMAYRDSQGKLAKKERRHAVYQEQVIELYDPDIAIEPRFIRSASILHEATISPGLSESVGPDSRQGSPRPTAKTDGSDTPMDSLLASMRTPAVNTQIQVNSAESSDLSVSMFSPYTQQPSARRKISLEELGSQPQLSSSAPVGAQLLRRGGAHTPTDDLDGLLSESLQYSQNVSRIASSGVDTPIVATGVSSGSHFSSGGSATNLATDLDHIQSPIDIDRIDFVTASEGIQQETPMYKASVDTPPFVITSPPPTTAVADENLSPMVKYTPKNGFLSKKMLNSVAGDFEKYAPLSQNRNRNQQELSPDVLSPQSLTDCSFLSDVPSMESSVVSPGSTESSPHQQVTTKIPFSAPLLDDDTKRTAKQREQKKKSQHLVMPPFDTDAFRELILAGNARDARALLSAAGVNNPTLPTKSDATTMLLESLEHVERMAEPLTTFITLVDMLGADVNAPSITGSSPLCTLFNSEELGSYLLSRGADILQNDQSGMCPLSLSFDFGVEWLLQEFQESGLESKLLASGDSGRIRKYVDCLIVGGYGAKASEIVFNVPLHVSISSDEATELLARCCGNFDNMKEAMETFELLEKLGAKVV